MDRIGLKSYCTSEGVFYRYFWLEYLSEKGAVHLKVLVNSWVQALVQARLLSKQIGPRKCCSSTPTSYIPIPVPFPIPHPHLSYASAPVPDSLSLS